MLHLQLIPNILLGALSWRRASDRFFFFFVFVFFVFFVSFVSFFFLSRKFLLVLPKIILVFTRPGVQVHLYNCGAKVLLGTKEELKEKKENHGASIGNREKL